MIKGYGVFESTKDYLDKKLVKKDLINDIYAVSSIGCGTYLGFPSDEVDSQYKLAIKEAITKGVNLIDTAINYRGMRSELVVRECIRELIEENKLNRSEIVVATKGGYLPADYRNIVVNENYRDTIKTSIEQFFEKEILSQINYDEKKISKILRRGNAIEKEVIAYLFEESRKNLDVETIDIYYLHNPEVSKADIGEELFYEELYETFLFLEQKVKEGHLKYYGMATYSGFIVDMDNPAYLSLEKIVQAAEKAGGKDNHLKFIQLPLNKAMRDAANIKNQKVKNELLTALDGAYELNIKVMTNVSLAQGQEFDKYSCEEMLEYLIENEKVCSSMIGMKKLANVKKNINMLL